MSTRGESEPFQTQLLRDVSHSGEHLANLDSPEYRSQNPTGNRPIGLTVLCREQPIVDDVAELLQLLFDVFVEPRLVAELIHQLDTVHEDVELAPDRELDNGPIRLEKLYQ